MSGCAGANLNMMQARCADRVDLIGIIDQGQFGQDFTECTQYVAGVLTKAQNETVARAIIGGVSKRICWGCNRLFNWRGSPC